MLEAHILTLTPSTQASTHAKMGTKTRCGKYFKNQLVPALALLLSAPCSPAASVSKLASEGTDCGLPSSSAGSVVL